VWSDLSGHPLVGSSTLCFFSFFVRGSGKEVANQVLAHLIIPNGLPWMVLIELDGLFKDELV
jgi:hypothetical protein